MRAFYIVECQNRVLEVIPSRREDGLWDLNIDQLSGKELEGREVNAAIRQVRESLAAEGVETQQIQTFRED